MPPRKQPAKSAWGKPPVLVAFISAAAAMGAALIGKPWEASPPPASPASTVSTPPVATVSDYVALLDMRASRVSSGLESVREAGLRAKFLHLHAKHIDAVRSGQQITSHELSNEINKLLEEVRKKHPSVPGYEGWVYFQ